MHVSRHRSIVPTEWLNYALVACGIAMLYAPILHADFVWDDKILFHDNAWFRQNENWPALLLHGFSEWRNYFRPLGLGLFLLEAKFFGTEATAFHAVSLALHLFNAWIVSRIAVRLLDPTDVRKFWAGPVAMLIYGVHPALVEPVSWIASQFDLLTTFFIFTGVLIHLSAAYGARRAILVGSCCLFGLLAKEAAIALPLLIFLLDIYRAERGVRIANFLRRNGWVYASLIAAVVLYYVVRMLAVDGIDFHQAQISTVAGYVQTIGYLYMKYWQIVFSPIQAPAPTHMTADVELSQWSPFGVAYCAAALLLLVIGFTLTMRRALIGVFVLGVTVTLVPVLHIIPISFDDSLFHERYAMEAIAIAIACMPALIVEIAAAVSRGIRISVVIIGVAWAIGAIATTRATIPFWHDELTFWQWAWHNQSDSIIIADHLLAADIDADRLDQARKLSRFVLAHDSGCLTCFLNVAYIALLDHDEPQARRALDRAGDAIARYPQSPAINFQYIVSIGNLRQLEGRIDDAESAYRDAIAVDPLNSDGHFCLALLLAREGRSAEATTIYARAAELTPADARERQRQLFAQATADGQTKPLRNKASND